MEAISTRYTASRSLEHRLSRDNFSSERLDYSNEAIILTIKDESHDHAYKVEFSTEDFW